MLLAFIGLYLLATIAIGWWASKRVKSTKDYVVAGKNLPLLIAASALFATWFGSETIMGASSEFVENGLLGVIEDPFGASLCLILVGRFYAGPLYNLNILTFNDFFNIRFSRNVEIISAIFMVPSYFGWIAAQLVALAIILNVLAGFPLIVGVMICCVVVVIYIYIGGMWAISITDFVQTIMILIGLIAIAVELYLQIGGLNKLFASTPEGFFRFFPERNFNSYIHYFAAWITIGLGSIPQQDIFQRVMAAKSKKVSINAAYLSGMMYLTIGFLPLFIGLAGKFLYPDLQVGDPQTIIPIMVLKHSGILLQILFFGALLSAILSTTSGAILAPATVIGENLVKPAFKNLSDAGLLQVMRTSVVLVALCSAAMAMSNTDIYDLVGQSSSFSLVSLFVPLTAGIYWKRASNTGAILSIFIGMIVWIYFEVMEFEFPSLVAGGLASLTGMLIGSWFFPDKTYTRFLELTKAEE